MDNAIILDKLFSSNNLDGVAKLFDVGNNSVYYQSLVTVSGPNANSLENTYYVIFKVPMDKGLFSGNSYKEIMALSIKNYVYKISRARTL